MLDIFEKLINEHGSSAILRERLGLIKTQYEALERENMNLKTQCQTQQEELTQHRQRIRDLESKLNAFQNGLLASHVCDHCGSSELMRIGNKPDPTFGMFGAKLALFRCNACGKESEFPQNL